MLKKEVLGFILNRIQFAILSECYRLIDDDVISVEDIDSIMSDGLGCRYAFMGPWETAHLNATGIHQTCQVFTSDL
jgi:L-gulonate 3-dehydrogenase